MRLNRAKQMRRHLRFYRIAYGVAPPYAVLLDGSFIHMALQVKMDILDRVKKLLLGEAFKCFVPRAVIDELKALGPATAASLQWAQACCEVLDPPPPPPAPSDSGSEAAPAAAPPSAADAIRALVGPRNEGKYMVATQDQELKADLRHVPSVALLFVARAVLLMEAPSGSSRAQSAAAERGKVRRLDEEERALLSAVKAKATTKGRGRARVGGSEQQSSQSSPSSPQQQQQQQQQQQRQQKVRLKKKARGPNPLSVKKGKEKGEGKQGSKRGQAAAAAAAAVAAGGEAKKRKRKHKKKHGAAAAAGGGGGAP